jgi:hypothetical protein
MLDTIVFSGAFVCLFSPAWDAVEFTLEFGLIFPLVALTLRIKEQQRYLLQDK